MKIWLIEDSDADAYMFCRAFSGHDVTHVIPNDSQPIIDQLPEGDADLIVVDMLLGPINGVEVIASLNNNNKINSAKVVISTGFSYLSSADKSDLDGYIDLFVTKPFTREKVDMVLGLVNDGKYR